MNTRTVLLISFFTFYVSTKEQTISLNFINEPIVNIVNKLASMKGANIILPLPEATAPGSTNFFDLKVNLYKNTRVTIDEAWDLLTIFLNVSGYSIYKRDDSYQVKALDKVNREPLPLYINTPAFDLPDNNEQIRYLYYFKKINIHNKTSKNIANLKSIIEEILISSDKANKPPYPVYTPPPANSASAVNITNTYELNSSQNSMMLTNPSSNIKTLMKIVEELDSQGPSEIVDVLNLEYAQPKDVEKLLMQLVKNLENEPFIRFGTQPTKPAASENIFSENTRVVAINNTNLAIIGNKNSVIKIGQFIKKNLDLPVREGLSLIHIKRIEYLKASDLVAPLKAILKGRQQDASSQQDQYSFGGYTQSKPATIAEDFSQVIITSESEEHIQIPQAQSQPIWGSQTAKAPASPIIGGNNLIIAAKEPEWLAIRELIESLDKPAWQVALQGLIVDMTIEDETLLATQLRDAICLSSPSSFNWQQSAMGAIPTAASSVMTSKNPTETIAANLGEKKLLLKGSTTQNPRYGYLAEEASTLINGGAGSTILTFKNGESGISAIMQILDTFANTTILSQPFVISTNNQTAYILSRETRIVQGGIDQAASASGNVVIKQVPITADLTINFTPRINSNGEDINMEVNISANEFAGEDNNKLTRTIITNSHLKNNQVLALGGLTQNVESDVEIGTPILSKIPVIGSLFKRKLKVKRKKTLMVFLSPTILKPQLKSKKMNDFTKEKLKYVLSENNKGTASIYGENFENLTDPVTRLFFAPGDKVFSAKLNNYADTGMYTIKKEDPFKIVTQD